MKKINRRNFLKGSGLVTLSSLGGLQLGFAKNILKGGQGGSGKDLLVYVFLNGGMDGLNMLPPRSGANYNHYVDLRPDLHIPNNQSLSLNGQSQFGMHPLATGMRDLFNANKMAIVHATGMVESNRSHFEATKFLELGYMGNSGPSTGWLTRYFTSANSSANAQIPSLVPSYDTSDAFLADSEALVVSDPSNFALNYGHWSWEDEMQNTLFKINESPNSLEQQAAKHALSSSAVIQSIDWDNYTPGNNADYPDSFFGEQMKSLAQLYKSDVGLEVAYVPTGGWDTHTGQGSGITGTFADLTSNLSRGLYALYQDLTASHEGQFTIVVQSEFGRRAYQNSDNSTDHGYGNPMFIIGDEVVPGFHGQYPGLASHQLYQGDDVDVTVDYRDVVSEILMKRMKNRYLGYIFPGYDAYTELGVVNGQAMTPNYDTEIDVIFKTGFDG